MIGAVGGNTNLYPAKSKSTVTVAAGKTEATKGVSTVDTKKQLEALKKDIADRLDKMQVNEKLDKLNVFMSDAFLEKCLKDPQLLEEKMKYLEEAFNEPINAGDSTSGNFAFLVMGDKTQMLKGSTLAEQSKKNPGLNWEKDFTSANAKALKELEAVADKNMDKIIQKFAADLVNRNIKEWTDADKKDKDLSQGKDQGQNQEASANLPT